MQTITIDTHEAIEALRAEKFTKEQAKVIVDTIRNVELYGVATTEDIRRLEEKIQNLSESTSDDIRRLEKEIQDIRVDITGLSHRVQQLETRLIIKLSGVMLIMMSFFKAMEHFF